MAGQIFFLNQNFLVQRESISALKKYSGDTVTVYDIESHPGDVISELLIENLDKGKCSLLFTINEWGIDGKGKVHSYVESHDCLHVNWCVDDPFYEELMHTRKFRPSAKRIDFVSDLGYLERMRKCGYNAYFLPLASDPGFFNPTDRQPEWENDVAFVGNSYMFQIEQFFKTVPESIKNHTNDLAIITKAYLKDCNYPIEDALKDLLRSLEITNGQSEEKSLFMLMHLVGFLQRKMLISAIVKQYPKSKVYGDKGWLQFIPADKYGRVAYYNGLCDVYRTSKVNVDINRIVIRNGFTQRVFDVLGSRSFLITSSKPILLEMFKTEGPEKDLVIFNNEHQLFSRIDYYLKNENERMKIAAQGCNTVHSKHTYDHRIQEIFRIISARS